MDFTHRQIDVQACLDRRQPVQDILTRGQGETWLVAMDGIKPGQGIPWTRFSKDDQLLLPLVPYLVVPTPELALAFTFQLCGQVMDQLIPAIGRVPRRLHLSVGSPLHEVQDDTMQGRMWQWYAGVAILL